MTKKRCRILFVGTDGSGKTSLSESCLESVPEAQYFYYGLKDYKISFLKYMNTDRFYFRYLFFPIECVLRNISLPQNGVVLIDRMPGWIYTRNNIGSRVLRLLMPKIDLLILCDAPEDVIFARKPEREVESLRKDRKKWMDFYQRFPAPQKIIIDTDKNNIQQACDIAMTEIEKIYDR